MVHWANKISPSVPVSLSESVSLINDNFKRGTIARLNTVQSTLLDNLGGSRFWTIPTGLQIITKGVISCRLDFLTIKFEIFLLFELLLTWNVSSYIMARYCNSSNNVAKHELFMCYIHRSKSTRISGSNDVICHAM